MQINKNYDNLEQSYLFSTIARKVNEYSAAHPEADIIRLGIGDVTRPLVPAVIDALHAAVEDQAKQETFHGYGDEQGYGFLHEALVGYYKTHGVILDTNEIFISDGAKSDLGNILDIFGADNTVLIPDPVYPVYVDTNVMAGRKVPFRQQGKRLRSEPVRIMLLVVELESLHRLPDLAGVVQRGGAAVHARHADGFRAAVLPAHLARAGGTEHRLAAVLRRDRLAAQHAVVHEQDTHRTPSQQKTAAAAAVFPFFASRRYIIRPNALYAFGHQKSGHVPDF